MINDNNNNCINNNSNDNDTNHINDMLGKSNVVMDPLEIGVSIRKPN